MKKKRIEENKKLALQLEKEKLEVEKIWAKVAPSLKPIEHVIIEKIYIEGLMWKEFMEEMKRKPEYSCFVYEKSAYMRYHKSAMEKLMEVEAV